MPYKTTCKWCGKTMTDDPGAFYHKARCQADWCTRWIRFHEGQLKTIVDDYEERRNYHKTRLFELRQQLERARYVGD